MNIETFYRVTVKYNNIESDRFGFKFKNTCDAIAKHFKVVTYTRHTSLKQNSLTIESTDKKVLTAAATVFIESLELLDYVITI